MILYTSGTTGVSRARADPPQPGEQRPHHRRAHHADRRDRRDHGLSAAVPLLRADVRDERGVQRGSPPHADPALRPRPCAGGYEARRGDGLRRVPTMYSALLNAAGDKAVPSLRSCISSGASLPGEVLRAFEAGIRLHHPRGLRTLGNVAGGIVQRARVPAQSRLGGPCASGRRDEGRRREGVDVPDGRSARSSSGART